MNNLISVIVPVYNSEEYIDRCLNSILSQSYKNIEIICVVNGSTDKSFEICTSYSKEHENIHVFESEKGVGKARNLGLTKVSGDWFAFIDSDDWIEPNYFELLLNNAIKYGATLSACQCKRDSAFKYSSCSDNNVKVLDSPDQCIRNYICTGLSLQGMSTNKIYKTSIYKDVRFDESIKVNEDCLYTFYIAEKCEKACVSDAMLYHWFIWNESASHAPKAELDFSAPNVFLQLRELTMHLNDDDVEYRLLANYFSYIINMLFCVKKYKDDTKAVEALENCFKWKKHVWKLMDYKTKIKYLIVWVNNRMGNY